MIRERMFVFLREGGRKRREREKNGGRGMGRMYGNENLFIIRSRSSGETLHLQVLTPARSALFRRQCASEVMSYLPLCEIIFAIAAFCSISSRSSCAGHPK